MAWAVVAQCPAWWPAPSPLAADEWLLLESKECRMTLRVNSSSCSMSCVEVYLSLLGSWSTLSLFLPPLTNHPTIFVLLASHRLQRTTANDSLSCSYCAGRLKGFDVEGIRSDQIKSLSKEGHALLARKSTAHARLFIPQVHSARKSLLRSLLSEVLLHCIWSKMQHVALLSGRSYSLSLFVGHGQGCSSSRMLLIVSYAAHRRFIELKWSVVHYHWRFEHAAY